MKKGIFAILAVLAVSGCSAKLPVVMAGNQAFKVNDASQYEWVPQAQDRIESFDQHNPTPRYVALFHDAVEGSKTQGKPALGAASDNLDKAAIFVAAGSTTAAKSAGLSPLAAANAATAILTADTTGLEIESSLQMHKIQVKDGSVTVARFIPGKGIVQGFTDAYPQLEPLLRENCNYSGKTLKLRVVGERDGKFAPYCAGQNKYLTVSVLNVNRFPGLLQALGEGVLVTYTVWGARMNEEQQVALADRLRATLPQDWYVLTSAPAKADAKEPLYHVSKGGVTKSFPVPAEPLAAK